jgi:hypothetical protein
LMAAGKYLYSHRKHRLRIPQLDQPRKRKVSRLRLAGVGIPC